MTVQLGLPEFIILAVCFVLLGYGIYALIQLGLWIYRQYPLLFIMLLILLTWQEAIRFFQSN